MSNHNAPFGNDGRQHVPPFPPAPFAQPEFLTLQEVESRLQHSQPQSRHKKYTQPMIDISHSSLQPTAQEFQPTVFYNTQIEPPTQSMEHTGAVRRNKPQQQQQRPNYKPRDNFKERKPKLTEDAVVDAQMERKQATGHNRDRRKPMQGQSQGQSRYNYNQNQNQDAPSNSSNYNNYNSNTSNGNGNSKFRNRNGYVENYKNSRDNAPERDYRDRKNYRDRDNTRDNTYKDNWRPNKSYNDRSSHKNWRERPSNTKIDEREKKNDEKSTDNMAEKKDEPKQSAQTSQNFYNTAPSNEKLEKETSYKKKLDAASQRERLEHMLTHRMIECLVCCEKVRHTDRVWSCKQCFHILHLSCVQKWAKSSKLENGWRCPACQNVLNAVPTDYRCYCDKYADPKFEPGLLAHSCGEVCRRSGRNCEHTCTLLCHPGPCPDCTVLVQKACGCGATKATVKCNSNLPLTCDAVCNKLLNCDIHVCGKKCHWDDCRKCTEKVKLECYCGKQGKKVDCVLETKDVAHYECGDVCQKLLACGNHKCVKPCHSGDCSLCPTDPDRIRSCPCGKKSLSLERKSCLDPIPCCDKVCAKVLNCGQPNKPHRCEATCHNGECPQCPATTMVRCRCGHMYKEIACRDLTTKADDARCQKKCTKMRMCSKHKCNQFCCIEIEHRCPLSCNRNLSCGLHKCESNCHSGRCDPCWHTSFEELYCECGATVIYPPVPCGTRAPACTRPCSRVRPCGHEPHHMCHTGNCPPCTLFTTKLCHGGHESRGTIPCHQEDFSCGMPCNAEMPCGQHRCVQGCHKGACPTPCTQPCTVPKVNCEHLCNRPCHDGPCPTKPCKQQVVTTCPCGLRTGTNICMNMAAEYQRLAMAQVAAKMADLNRGQVVDIGDVVKVQMKGGAHKILECTDECRLVERNRRMAIGLQLRNPDLSAKLTPRYTDYLKQWAKKDARFCQSVHDKLTELVQLAKQSKQKSRSHSFECMNREKRHFVHELCEHFGVESAAYDAEPNRNVVATASKEKSWLPSCSLIELIQRENGQRKVPGPVLKPPMRNLNAPSAGTSSESVSLRLQSGRTDRPRPATPPGEFIDYFDNPPV
ncbi:protein shuttle craft [Atheta coriaria]|uniref:protein shuttle craft n=1 Tax=Dalotia coriaria TaxID=877792 RepID=UPI0031F3ABB6